MIIALVQPWLPVLRPATLAVLMILHTSSTKSVTLQSNNHAFGLPATPTIPKTKIARTSIALMQALRPDVAQVALKDLWPILLLPQW